MINICIHTLTLCRLCRVRVPNEKDSRIGIIRNREHFASVKVFQVRIITRRGRFPNDKVCQVRMLLIPGRGYAGGHHPSPTYINTISYILTRLSLCTFKTYQISIKNKLDMLAPLKHIRCWRLCPLL